TTASARISACLVDISSWMTAYELKLNPSKTELLIIPDRMAVDSGKNKSEGLSIYFNKSWVWVAGAPAHDRYPKHIAPDPYAPSCGWWAYRKVGLRCFFGLCPAESCRQRLGHQALACVPQPQAWLQGGAPNPFALGDPTRSTRPLTTWLLGSFGYSNSSTTIRWRFKEGNNIAWRSGTVPLDWATGVVVPLFKKGDRRVCSNYRGITLLSLPGKVYSRVLERKVRPLVEPRIQEEQCGFRPSRGTLDQLYTLHRVLEGSWEFAQPVHMCFVDLEKAFDRVPRGILWEVLWEYGVRGPLLRAVRSLYNRSRSLVRIASCKSDLFPVHVGLRQGCPLSPVLFIVFMDRISRRSQGLEGVRFGDHRISSLIFADDVVLLASSGLDLQHALGRFAAECEAAGMKVSTSKSEAMVLDRKKVACTLQVGGEVFPQVEEFKYLGVLFTSEGRMDREIDRRIGAAAAVMRSMYRSVVVKKELSRKAKLSIYQSIYAPTLTHGHELWVMTERVRSRIQAAKMSFLRRVAGRSLRDRVRSSVTREELGVEPLLLRIERGQLRWLGHLFWLPPGRLPGEVFRACPTGKRPRGRPRTRWRDYVFRLAWERLGVPPEELEEVAREREVWASLLRLLPPRPGKRNVLQSPGREV
ncbi:hypothetical protein QTP86_004180, partial [Hemibagrus guttatus]